MHIDRRIPTWATSLLVILFTIAVSCKDDDPDPVVTVTGFSPQSGFEGTAVVVSGTNFSIVGSQNTVSFNGTSANVTAATLLALRGPAPGT